MPLPSLRPTPVATAAVSRRPAWVSVDVPSKYDRIALAGRIVAHSLYSLVHRKQTLMLT